MLCGTWAPLKLIRIVLFLHVAVHTANYGIDHAGNAAEQTYAPEWSRLRAERLRRVCPPYLHVFCTISTFFARMAQRARDACATLFLSARVSMVSTRSRGTPAIHADPIDGSRVRRGDDAEHRQESL